MSLLPQKGLSRYIKVSGLSHAEVAAQVGISESELDLYLKSLGRSKYYCITETKDAVSAFIEQRNAAKARLSPEPPVKDLIVKLPKGLVTPSQLLIVSSDVLLTVADLLHLGKVVPARMIRTMRYVALVNRKKVSEIDQSGV